MFIFLLILTFIGISVLGALIDHHIVFSDGVSADYGWTYRPNIMHWTIGLTLIYLTFFVPLFLKYRRSIHVPIIIANFSVMMNIATWLMLPHIVHGEGWAQVQAAKGVEDLTFTFAFERMCAPGMAIVVVLSMLALILGKHLSSSIWRKGDHRYPSRRRDDFSIFRRALTALFVSLLLGMFILVLMRPTDSCSAAGVLYIVLLAIFIRFRVWPYRLYD